VRAQKSGMVGNSSVLHTFEPILTSKTRSVGAGFGHFSSVRRAHVALGHPARGPS